MNYSYNNDLFRIEIELELEQTFKQRHEHIEKDTFDLSNVKTKKNCLNSNRKESHSTRRDIYKLGTMRYNEWQL